MDNYTGEIMPKQLCPTEAVKKNMDQSLAVGQREIEERNGLQTTKKGFTDKNNPQPVWKRVKVFKMFCPICNTIILGNGNPIFPYRCNCGTWNFDYTNSKWTITKDEGGA